MYCETSSPILKSHSGEVARQRQHLCSKTCHTKNSFSKISFRLTRQHRRTRLAIHSAYCNPLRCKGHLWQAMATQYPTVTNRRKPLRCEGHLWHKELSKVNVSIRRNPSAAKVICGSTLCKKLYFNGLNSHFREPRNIWQLMNSLYMFIVRFFIFNLLIKLTSENLTCMFKWFVSNT